MVLFSFPNFPRSPTVSKLQLWEAHLASRTLNALQLRLKLAVTFMVIPAMCTIYCLLFQLTQTFIDSHLKHVTVAAPHTRILPESPFFTFMICLFLHQIRSQNLDVMTVRFRLGLLHFFAGLKNYLWFAPIAYSEFDN